MRKYCQGPNAYDAYNWALQFDCRTAETKFETRTCRGPVQQRDPAGSSLINYFPGFK